MFMDAQHRECKLGVGPRLSCVRTKLRIAAGWLAGLLNTKMTGGWVPFRGRMRLICRLHSNTF